ncbi:N-acetyltransferase family protein [Rhizobium johnstonii]|uniref:GNAT family N-acetyltransferase n=2 Tax=Rhizobium leguminosarum TaxID=384 RepID=A0A8G2MRN5_RHILV|nr:GNAT family N-acetyltransferase [Rhizobium leguminosarum]WSG97281.1 GNAT family N-acetyltransferase [Rhizobium johnstonii]MBB4507504.1 ribosomal-protein-alanine N-acetyltransferase [Rhizobium leguminosarum]MBY5385185.1 GNAT family N-acetyltransferase [Rhizobium leguminosarum]MBY5419050.1 GNAT family N-acetyltransferase [Rhizobium leguminosarum]MCA2433524.1 GNAT family N-acetyltransferase [Rhizobium leguminosarum]
MIHIRNARDGEAELLSEIGLRAWQNAMASIGESDAMIDAARNAFRNFVENDWLTITVVEQNGQVAGWAAREGLDETISDFWIDPVFTRQGLGSALLVRIEKEIADQGLGKAAMQTHSGNSEAIGFFRKHGYSIHWLSVAYNPKLDRDVPSVGLTKQLVSDSQGAYGLEF